MSFRIKTEKLKSYFISHQKVIKNGVTILWMFLLFLLSWQLWKSRDQLAPYMDNINWIVFVEISFFYFLALIFAILGWISIISVFAPNISIWVHFKIYLATMAAKRLPGTVWYISGRAVIYRSMGVSQIKTASASGLEIIISFLANCVIAIIVLPLGIIQVESSYILLLIIGMVASLLIVNPRTISWFMDLIKRPLVQPIRLWQPFIWLLFRFAVILSGGLMVFQIVKIFQPMANNILWAVLGARALSGAASFLTFFLPSSFGAADITLAAMLSTIMPLTLSGLTALAVRLITTFFDVILGILFYFIVNKQFILEHNNNHYILTETENESENLCKEDSK